MPAQPFGSARRVESAVEALPGGGGEKVAVPADRPHATETALAHLHGLERALAELAVPLRAPSRSPLVSA